MGFNPEGDIATATLCTDDITLRTYWRAIVATFSCRLLSNGNWKAMVNTERLFPEDVASPAPWFVEGPTSRLDVRSSVRFVMDSYLSNRSIDQINNFYGNTRHIPGGGKYIVLDTNASCQDLEKKNRKTSQVFKNEIESIITQIKTKL